MKKKTLSFFADAGHGWLKVSRKLLEDPRLKGVAQDISQYSYQRKSHVFLEEDSDAQKFLAALVCAGIEPIIKSKKVATRESKIRGYHSYVASPIIF